MFKSLFISWLIKLVEIILVVLLGYLICLLVGMITKETAIGIATVSIVFYFFGGLIRPYIKDLQSKITKNLGKKEDKWIKICGSCCHIFIGRLKTTRCNLYHCEVSRHDTCHNKWWRIKWKR